MTPAAAAHDGEATIDVLPAEASVGDTVQVLGENFEPGATVEIAMATPEGDEPVASLVADDEGHFSAGVTLRDGLETRYYELRAAAEGDGPDSGATTLVHVTAPEAGSSWLVLAAAAGAVLAAGFAVLLLVRRSRRGVGAST